MVRTATGCATERRGPDGGGLDESLQQSLVTTDVASSRVRSCTRTGSRLVPCSYRCPLHSVATQDPNLHVTPRRDGWNLGVVAARCMTGDPRAAVAKAVN